MGKSENQCWKRSALIKKFVLTKNIASNERHLYTDFQMPMRNKKIESQHLWLFGGSRSRPTKKPLGCVYQRYRIPPEFLENEIAIRIQRLKLGVHVNNRIKKERMMTHWSYYISQTHANFLSWSHSSYFHAVARNTSPRRRFQRDCHSSSYLSDAIHKGLRSGGTPCGSSSSVGANKQRSWGRGHREEVVLAPCEVSTASRDIRWKKKLS